MEALLKASEASALMGLSVRHVQRMAKSDELPYQTHMNERNRPEYLFPLSSLPDAAQQKYFAEHAPAALPAAAPAKAKKADKPAACKPLEAYTAEERGEIGYWITTVDRWQTYRNKAGTKKAECDEKFVLLCRMEEPDRQISVETLYRKWAAIREGDYGALVDMRGKARKGMSKMPEAIERVFLSLFLDESQLPVPRCIALTEEWAQQNMPEAMPLPGYHTFYRKAKAVPYPVMVLCRMGEKKYYDLCSPYIRREYESINANDFWVGDTHSQNQFAAKVNLSSAALSSYLNQKYKGSVEAVERQLSEFFKLDEEAEAAAEKTASLLPRAAYVPTSISEDVCQSIRFAQLEHCMVVLHGDAGVGKSKGAQKFLRDHPTNAVGISITPSTGTLNGSIKLLARALRVPECRNKMDQMMALRSRLDGTNWVIVIDEAQHLKYAALEEIRSLTDDNPMTGEHGVGVVLIGNSEVYSRLQGRQQAQFAQLFSRIRMQREYTTRKVKEDDVRKLFPVLAEQDARKEMDFLLSVCRSPWGIRGAMNLYTNAASANDVSYENLCRMAAHMGIGMLGAV